MKTAESKTTTTAATTAAKTPTSAFFSQEPQRASAFFGVEAAEAAPFFSPRTIQPKLTIGKPNDHYEQQADSVADQVVAKLNAPTPSVPPTPKGRNVVQAKCDHCTQEEKLQKKDEDTSPNQNATGGTQSNFDDQSMVIQEEFVPQDAGPAPDQKGLMSTVNSDSIDDDQINHSNLIAAPPVGFIDRGRTGTARYGDSLIANNDTRPHAFTDGGQTSTVIWSGGGGAGARGNQGAGSIQVQILPTFVGRTISPTDAEAWIQIGTGRLDVVRSWVGINSGNQGNGFFVTPGAAARINLHETLHVANTLTNYNTHIDTLLTRVGQFYAGIGTQHAATQPAAITALQNFIQWATSVTAFQNADIAANTPGGTVDTNDVASGTYPVDGGPGTVGGTPFLHRIRLPAEANPPA